MFIKTFSDSQENLQFLREKPKFRVQSDSPGRNNCDSWEEERFEVYVFDHKSKSKGWNMKGKD